MMTNLGTQLCKQDKDRKDLRFGLQFVTAQDYSSTRHSRFMWFKCSPTNVNASLRGATAPPNVQAADFTQDFIETFGEQVFYTSEGKG